MKHLICIILLWIAISPAMTVICIVGIKSFNSLEALQAFACILLAGALGAGGAILTSQSWARYKLSGHKLVVTLEDVFNVLAYIAGSALIVALVTGIFSWNTITWIALCTFAITASVLILTLFVDLLLRKN